MHYSSKSKIIAVKEKVSRTFFAKQTLTREFFYLQNMNTVNK